MGDSAPEPVKNRPGQCTAWCAKRVAKKGKVSQGREDPSLASKGLRNMQLHGYRVSTECCKHGI